MSSTLVEGVRHDHQQTRPGRPGLGRYRRRSPARRAHCTCTTKAVSHHVVRHKVARHVHVRTVVVTRPVYVSRVVYVRPRPHYHTTYVRYAPVYYHHSHDRVAWRHAG
ncbi:MAG: hypothetical protein WDN06_01000 [Asticcacaulis sp.]